jgi:hypothetical protein
MKAKTMYQHAVDQAVRTIRRSGYITEDTARDILNKRFRSDVAEAARRICPEGKSGLNWMLEDNDYTDAVFKHFYGMLAQVTRSRNLPHFKYAAQNSFVIYALTDENLQRGYDTEVRKLGSEDKKGKELGEIVFKQLTSDSKSS